MELYGVVKPCRVYKKRSSKVAVSARGGGDGGNAGKGRPSFSCRCARLVKEQRARFYIMRRCVTMLVCWREYQ